jgi:hypothetical protein
MKKHFQQSNENIDYLCNVVHITIENNGDLKFENDDNTVVRAVA